MGRRTWCRALLAGFLMTLTGCGAGPGKSTMTNAQLEKYMAKELKLRELKLKDEGGGRFTGTAKDDKELVVELEVTQGKNEISWSTRSQLPDGKINVSGGGTSWSGR